MFTQLTLATAMVLTTAVIHLTGLAILVRLLRSHSRTFSKLRIMPLTLLLSAAVGIIALHTVEIWLYAALYLALGNFTHFEEALYFSTVTYSSIGYGDVLLPHSWRIFGAIEGAAGIIMLGVSTAFRLVAQPAEIAVARLAYAHLTLTWCQGSNVSDNESRQS